ncbi:MAG: class I SAM-dependent methyltransferase [Lachnospiraceae bacterium]|nr:class I SAM-dependent methyltransferase [Lachnospiraceae bacterium]
MDHEDAGVYTSFAEVYDAFMDNVPYEEWCTYLVRLLRKYGCEGGLVAELGCGTGTMTELLAQAGYDMIGIDCSEEMLAIAMEKRAETGSEILYLLQDMREFELYGTVAAVVSVCDSLNYLTEYEDLVQTFRLVNNFLDPGGVFLFDLNTEYKYRELLGERTIAENREDQSFIWDNYYDEEQRINEYGLTLFIKEESGLYRKQEEFHYQRAYSLEEVREALSEAGMEFVDVYDAFTKEPPKETSGRIHVIAREHGKQLRNSKTWEGF